MKAISAITLQSICADVTAAPAAFRTFATSRQRRVIMTTEKPGELAFGNAGLTE